MHLSEERKRRIIGIYDGSVTPLPGMEMHFLRVCRGSSSPVTAEEKLWYVFLGSQLSEREAAESKEAEKDKTYGEIERLEALIEKQRERIQILLVEKREILDRLKIYEPPLPFNPAVCPACGGQGGAHDDCYLCGGSGWYEGMKPDEGDLS